MMKKFLSLVLTAAILLIPLGGLTAYAATGSLTASASASTVTVGDNVTVTLTYSGGGAKIASIDPQITYNAKAFQYVSCVGAIANGGAGVVRMSYYATTATPPTSVSITLTFKAIAAGAANFSVTTSEFYNDEDYSSLGNPSKTIAVSAINPTLSANANLANITPNSGTLTPKFDANVTNYTISVPYGTTSLVLTAKAQENGAKITVTGKNTLAVGSNTQVITVTAPNGTTKQYTVVINRSPNQTTTTTTTTTRPPSGSTTPPTSTSTTTTTTTTTVPDEDALEVAVDGVLMTITDTQTDAPLPEGFSWTHITINNISVAAAVNETTDMTLLYLKNALDDTSAFYIYEEATEEFHVFCPLKVNGGEYVLLDMPAGLIPPTGAVAGMHTFGTTERNVYTFEDTALEDVVLVYATSPAGKTGLYCYDVTDGSMQLYREITVAADNEPQTEPTTAPSGAFAQFVTQNRQIILICSAAAGGVALLIAAITLLVITTRKDKECKH